MIKRYSNSHITAIWTDEAKLARWDKVELAVLRARVKLELLTRVSYDTIKLCLARNPPDIDWWLKRDKEISHDLNAYVDERRRHLPVELRFLFHKDMTSYDTEEAAFTQALVDSSILVLGATDALLHTLGELARKHRYTLMLARTHGQWAKLKSFGVRVVTWYGDIAEAKEQLTLAVEGSRRSRLSGAVGNYGGGLTPELEREALDILGFNPYLGATQIMPRVVFMPLAQSLSSLCQVLNKVAVDFRLGARSGKPLWREPFGKKQKGSSAMPHKRNPIKTEQMAGMARMAASYASMIEKNIETWEERAIEQSCVERVAWPDLFHVTMQMLTAMSGVFSGIEVYPDHMLQEILESRGTYASDEAKNFLGEVFSERAMDAEDAYRIVQLAAFNVFEPQGLWAKVRGTTPESIEAAETLLLDVAGQPPATAESIETFIRDGRLRPTESLEATPAQVEEWNKLLRELFLDEKIASGWEELFRPSHVLQQEPHLFSILER